MSEIIGSNTGYGQQAVGYGNCPSCGQPATTAGFLCGCNDPSRQIGQPRRPGAVPYTPLIPNTPTDINEWIKGWKPADFVFTNPDLIIKQLREELEEQWALRDLPRKMFSIKLYLNHMAAEKDVDRKAYHNAYIIVHNKELELNTYDWSATRDKYREYFKHQYKTIPKAATT